MMHFLSGMTRNKELDDRYWIINLPVENGTRKILENQCGLELNGIHFLLVYADDVNLVVGNINTINKQAETLLDTYNGLCLEANAKNAKYYL
jgi:hypothetical protein